MALTLLWTIGIAASLAGAALLAAAFRYGWRNPGRLFRPMLIALGGFFLLAIGLPLLRASLQLSGGV